MEVGFLRNSLIHLDWRRVAYYDQCQTLCQMLFIAVAATRDSSGVDCRELGMVCNSNTRGL